VTGRIAARFVVVGALLAACPGPATAPLVPPRPATPDAAIVDAAPPDAATVAPLPWLKGSTHVHAKPSGDSTTEIPDVIAYYERHGYDFIVLTDHNQVSEVDRDTSGSIAVRANATGLVVLAGIELTFNPNVCLPQEVDMKCRIHVNALGVTKRPVGKMDWPDRQTEDRRVMYDRALATATDLGGIAQLNHPQWQWGMSAELLIALGRAGFRLVEIANRQFDNWNAGDATHPSMEALWDAALVAGVDLWGVSSDDAHQYQEDGGGRYPAGGGWVMVRAQREPQAILDALATGQFYASTGVVLAKDDVEAGALVVEVDAASEGDHVITFVANATVVQTVTARSGRAEIPAGGYVRAVIRRASDGAMAWTQPVRR
jgi:hypothetical protein